MAGVAILVLAASESAPVVGAVIPGTATIIAIAALVSSSTERAIVLTMAGAIGAMLGDCASYSVGRYFADSIQARAATGRMATMMQRSRAFFARHGDKSVFLARFLPGVRAVVPLAAGATCMPLRRFYPASIASGFVWASTHILPAALLGMSYALGNLKLLAAIAALLVLSFAAYHLVRASQRARRSRQCHDAYRAAASHGSDDFTDL